MELTKEELEHDLILVLSFVAIVIFASVSLISMSIGGRTDLAVIGSVALMIVMFVSIIFIKNPEVRRHKRKRFKRGR